MTLPTPKSRSRRKKVSPEAAKRPRLVWAKAKDEAKKEAVKKSMKKTGIAPGEKGSTKYTQAEIKAQSKSITIKLKKKFFLLLTCFCLIFLRTISF